MTETSDRLAAALAGRYRIERELGAGGMATVWLAHDLKHDRKVAIKVLHPHLAALVGADRFLKEIRTTANLQHPHILPLFDSGEADGLLYYVMPYLTGETLRQAITRDKQLPIADALRITSEITVALDYAHRRGVIHRDIKPENILLHEGQALVADFGIAIATDSGDARLTETGLSVGTPSYMSPEQALGERNLDARSDVYAVGIVLYEMLTGVPPFTGPSAQAVFAKVIAEKPVPPSRHRKEIPARLDHAVLNALEKRPDDRFATAAAFQVALAGRGSASSQATRHFPVWPLAPLALAAIAIAVYVVSHRASSGSDAPRSVAVLPFRNTSGDSANSIFGEGLREEVEAGLRQIPHLTVIDASARRFGEPNLDVRVAGRELAADVILSGVLRRADTTVRMNVELQDARTLAILFQQAYDSKPGDLYKLEDDLAHSIASDLSLTFTPAQLAASTPGRTENPDAHKLVVRARGYANLRNKPALEKAMALFTAAIELDSSYAQAWAGRATAHNLRAVLAFTRPSEDFAAAMQDAAHALKIDSTVAEAHTALGFVHVYYDRDWGAAATQFNRAVALDSMLAATWLFRMFYYVATGHTDSAIRSGRRAQALDPSSPAIATRLGGALYQFGKLKDAEAMISAALVRNPKYGQAHSQLASVYADDDQCALALKEAASRQLDGPQMGNAESFYASARCGQRTEPRRFVDSLVVEANKGNYVDAFAMAKVYAGLDDRENVIKWLRRAVDDGDWELFLLRIDPAFRNFRSDPRFQELQRKVFGE